MTQSYESKRRKAFWLPVLEQLYQMDESSYTESIVENLSRIEKLYESVIKEKIVDETEEKNSIFKKIEMLLEIDEEENRKVSFEILHMLLDLQCDNDELDSVLLPHEYTDDKITELLCASDPEYKEIVKSDLYKILSELFKWSLMKHWSDSAEETPPNKNMIDEKFEELLDLWLYITKHIKFDSHEWIDEISEKLDSTLGEHYTTTEIKNLVFHLSEQKNRFEKYCFENLESYMTSIMQELLFIMNVAIDNYIFKEKDYDELIKILDDKKEINVKDIEDYFLKIDDSNLLDLVKARMLKSAFCDNLLNSQTKSLEHDGHVDVTSLTGKQIEIRPKEAAESIFLNQDGFEISKNKPLKTGNLNIFNKHKNIGNIINNDYMYLQIDLTYDKKEILQICDDIISKAQKIIGKEKVEAKTMERQKIFEKLFLHYYLQPKSKEKALEETEKKLEKFGIKLSYETLNKQYLKRLKNKHNVQSVSDLREIIKKDQG